MAIRKVLILFLVLNKYSWIVSYAIPWPEGDSAALLVALK